MEMPGRLQERVRLCQEASVPKWMEADEIHAQVVRELSGKLLSPSAWSLKTGGRQVKCPVSGKREP